MCSVLGYAGDVCPPGFYCPEGTAQPLSCENGTYMDHAQGSECDICPEGYYCVHKDRAVPCLQGFYCPEGTGVNLRPCPTGTFGNTTGLGDESQCTQCTGNAILSRQMYF